MEKKGQVTTFIIIGIVIVLAVILAYYLRNNVGIGIGSQQFLSLKSEPIKQDVIDCAKVNANDALDLIGKQGGTLNPVSYTSYKGNKVDYLCTDIPNSNRCANRLMGLADIEKEINNYLGQKVKDCVNTKELAKKLFYTVETGGINVSSNIGLNQVLININYSITLRKGDATETIKEFKTSVDVPLGALYNHAFNIVDSWAKIGDFDQLPYMLSKRGSVEINIDKPFPDKVYILNMRDSNYIFEFAIEGEG